MEKPSVLLQEAKGEPVSAPSGGGPPGQPATLADALSLALNKRKGKLHKVMMKMMKTGDKMIMTIGR